MNLMKRGLALLLTLTMVISLCAATVWAANETASEYEATSQFICEDDLGITNDELFSYYVQREFDEALGYETPAMWRTSAFESGSPEQILYDGLKADLEDVANGEVTSTMFTVNVNGSFTKEDLGLTGSFLNGAALSVETQDAIDSKLNEVYICLLADCPMEMYWHDKTSGFQTSYRCSLLGDTLMLTQVTYRFFVAKDYSATGTTGTFVTDSKKTSTAVNAITNAVNIVKKHEAKSDLEKLTAYKDEICSMVEYNNAAAESSPAIEGINPWQMVYVFDDDASTNVVCEGYAKAFQYLCDLTDFKSKQIECHTVNGMMSGGTGAGRHMWNVVTMDNGKNYLVDVTNCDGTSIGAPNKLFMAYTDISANSHQSHTFTILNTKVVFTYAENMKDLFCDGYLDLATTAYKQSLVASVSLSGNNSVQAGTDVTLKLKVSGTDILGVEAALDYDEDVLEYRSYSGLLNGWDVTSNGSKFVMSSVDNPINEMADVMSVTFRVKRDIAVGTEFNVAFKNIVVSDGNADHSVGTATWNGTVDLESATQIGDLDGDEKITVIDLQLLFEHIQKIKLLDASALSVADVNDDGSVNIIDQQMLFEHVQGISLLP